MGCTKQVKERISTDAPSTARSLCKARNLIAILAAAVTVAVFAPRAHAEDPSASQVLRMVRANEAGQDRDLTGQLRMGSLRIPFLLRMRGPTISYQFGNPTEAMVLRLGDKGSSLNRVTGSGSTEKIAGAKLDDLVRGTDVSYEDLALKFLYWKNAKNLGSRQLNVSDCWMIEAVPASKDESQYDLVRLWVQKSGALLRAECFSGGKLIRRFAVIGVQRDKQGNGYILKSMRVEFADGRGRDREPTYLEIKQ